MCLTSSDYPNPLQLQNLNSNDSGDTCWACKTESPQTAHVVAKEDKQVGNGVSIVSHSMWMMQPLESQATGNATKPVLSGP